MPWFGNKNSPEIYFKDSLNNGQSGDDSYKTFFNGQKLTDREVHWDVKELEAYKIIYI